MTVEEVIFEIPVNLIPDGLTENQMSFAFTSPPVVLKANEDWMGEILEARDTDLPHKGDQLVFVGSVGASFMTKEQFEQVMDTTVAALQNNACAGAEPPTLKLRFKRGLNIDFVKQFRQVLPSVLRKTIGVPLVQGRELAKNVNMAQMKQLVFTLQNGGLKPLDDLATSAGCEVNFGNAWRSHMPTLLVSRAGAPSASW